MLFYNDNLEPTPEIGSYLEDIKSKFDSTNVLTSMDMKRIQYMYYRAMELNHQHVEFVSGKVQSIIQCDTSDGMELQSKDEITFDYNFPDSFVLAIRHLEKTPNYESLYDKMVSFVGKSGLNVKKVYKQLPTKKEAYVLFYNDNGGYVGSKITSRKSVYDSCIPNNDYDVNRDFIGEDGKEATITEYKDILSHIHSLSIKKYMLDNGYDIVSFVIPPEDFNKVLGCSAKALSKVESVKLTLSNNIISLVPLREIYDSVVDDIYHSDAVITPLKESGASFEMYIPSYALIDNDSEKVYSVYHNEGSYMFQVHDKELKTTSLIPTIYVGI